MHPENLLWKPWERLKGLPYEHNTILEKIEEFFINALVSAPTASP